MYGFDVSSKEVQVLSDPKTRLAFDVAQNNGGATRGLLAGADVLVNALYAGGVKDPYAAVAKIYARTGTDLAGKDGDGKLLHKYGVLIPRIAPLTVQNADGSTAVVNMADPTAVRQAILRDRNAAVERTGPIGAVTDAAVTGMEALDAALQASSKYMADTGNPAAARQKATFAKVGAALDEHNAAYNRQLEAEGAATRARSQEIQQLYEVNKARRKLGLPPLLSSVDQAAKDAADAEAARLPKPMTPAEAAARGRKLESAQTLVHDVLTLGPLRNAADALQQQLPVSGNTQAVQQEQERQRVLQELRAQGIIFDGANQPAYAPGYGGTQLNPDGTITTMQRPNVQLP